MKIFILLLFVAVSEQLSPDESIEILAADEQENETQSLYTFKKPLKIHRLGIDEKREIYYYEQTFVIRDAGLDDKVRRCQLFEVYEEHEPEKVAKFLKKTLKKTIQQVDMNKMLYLLNDCDSVDNVDPPESSINDIFNFDLSIPSYSYSLTSGIYPGTNWCGFRDTASTYHDLAELRNVDRCCRAHDFCPVKVFSYDTRYNLTNVAVHTKSHCLCDEAIHKCLTADNSWAANFIGQFYFYVTSPECISGLPEAPGSKLEFVPATKTWYMDKKLYNIFE